MSDLTIFLFTVKALMGLDWGKVFLIAWLMECSNWELCGVYSRTSGMRELFSRLLVGLGLLIGGVCNDGVGDGVVECVVVGDAVVGDGIDAVGAVVVAVGGAGAVEGESDVGVVDGKAFGMRDGDLIAGRDGVSDDGGWGVCGGGSNCDGLREGCVGDAELVGLLGDDGGLGRNRKVEVIVVFG